MNIKKLLIILIVLSITIQSCKKAGIINPVEPLTPVDSTPVTHTQPPPPKPDSEGVNLTGTILYTDSLRSISTEWTNKGWVHVNGGITPTAEGFGNYIQLNRQYDLHAREAISRIRFGTGTRLLLFTRNAEQASNGGTIIECDAEAGKIKIYRNYAGDSTLSEVLAEKPYKFETDRDYIIDLKKDNILNSIKVTDTKSNLADSLEDSSSSSGRQQDYYALAVLSGDRPLIRNFSVTTPVKKGCTFIVFGDSITEGNYAPLQPNDGYAYQLLNAIHDNSGVSGRGSGKIAGVTNRIATELAYVKPKYAIITIGTNNGNTISNWSLLVNKIEALGVTPILNHVPCKPGSYLAQNAVIDSVRRKFKLTGCLFDVATSINKDISKGLDATLYNYDNGTLKHPNVLGQEALFSRFQIDVPEIFNH